MTSFIPAVISLPLDILQTIQQYFHYDSRCQGDVVFGFGKDWRHFLQTSSRLSSVKKSTIYLPLDRPHSLRYLKDDDFFRVVNERIAKPINQVSLNLSFYGEELQCSSLLSRLQRVNVINLLFADLSKISNQADITALDNVVTAESTRRKGERDLTHAPFKALSNAPTCCNVRRNYVLCPGLECGRSWCYFHCADHFRDVRRCGADDCDKMICPTARAPEACCLCSDIFCHDCLVPCNDADCDLSFCEKCAVLMTSCHSCHRLFCLECMGRCTSSLCSDRRISRMNCMNCCDICSAPVFCPCQYSEMRLGVRCIDCVEEELVEDEEEEEDKNEDEEESSQE